MSGKATVQVRILVELGKGRRTLKALAESLYGSGYSRVQYGSLSRSAIILQSRVLVESQTVGGEKVLRLAGEAVESTAEIQRVESTAVESSAVVEARPDWMPGGLLGQFCRLVGWTPDQGLCPGHFSGRPAGHQAVFSVGWESGEGIVRPSRWGSWDKASRAHLWAVLADLGHGGSRLAGDAFVWLSKLPFEPWAAPSWGSHEAPIRAWLQSVEELFPRWVWPFEGALFVPVEPRRIRGEWAPRPGWPMLKSGSLKPVTLGEPFTPGKVSGWTFDKGLGTFVRVTPESAPAASG